MGAPRLELVLQDLYARVPRGIELGLASMHAACTRFDFPERAYEAVHIAGTNGKGSTAAMVERIAREAGKKTGLYTSPHLHRFAERIRVGGEPLDDAVLAELLHDVLRREPGLTFFEAATLTAFLAFREARVDLAVLEVGLGGRLDATNVIPSPRSAAITRIAFDHQDKLGNTLPEIAREKAAIAKPGLDIVLGPMSAEVESAIVEVASRAGATTSRAAELAAGANIAHIGLPGAHQLDNARIAWVIGERLGIAPETRARGIANVTWAGRLERLETAEGPVLLDAAHNPDGAGSLAEQLGSLQARGALVPSETALIFGALADKAWPNMIDRIAPFAATRIYVTPKGRKPADPRAIAARCAGLVAGSFEEAIAEARTRVGRGLVLVTGSIFLVGEARGKLLGIEGDPPVAL
ncbi:bifunctional folylpolyglutamate synthase/dihydrofolate synthase [Pendulispora albinea]|uniref:Dihydrofolate synthase/folylpolyglutamate synthase n=1 Tax=Pendulispora albinea TaxID=2741071 RepID=A0ABZ2M1D9_9BACT